MQRENVKENFSHYQVPRVLRVLVEDGKDYRTKLRHRAESIGIMGKDEADLQFVLEHWQLITMAMKDEPHEEVIRLIDCENQVAWLESMLVVALADKEASA